MTQPLHRLLAPTLLALAAASEAQTTLTHTGGNLGQAITYDLSTVPGFTHPFYLLLPSFQTGPVPLALFDPGDPRVLNVGIDLLDFSTFSGFDPFGDSSVTYALPSSAVLAGLQLHAQYVEIGLPLSFGNISNRVTHTLGLPCGSALIDGPKFANNGEPIYTHTATRLDDGRILIAGGYTETIPSGNAIPDLSAFDPQDESFTEQAAKMQNGRVVHTATRLLDGRVLFVGGFDESTTAKATAEVWDPVTDTMTIAPDMSIARALHTATLLPSGKVLVAGGVSDYQNFDVIAALQFSLKSSEIYDPVTNTWTAGPDMPLPRAAHAASQMGDGRVLLTGGIELVGGFLPAASTSALRFDEAAPVIWITTSSYTGARAFHGQLTLNDGRVLIAGGTTVSVVAPHFTPTATTRVYNPAANTWTNTGNLNTARMFPFLFNADDDGDGILDDVVLIGGLTDVPDLLSFSAPGITPVEKSNQFVLFWTSCGDLVRPRQFGGVYETFENGRHILVTGAGHVGGNDDDTAEVFNP